MRLSRGGTRWTAGIRETTVPLTSAEERVRAWWWRELPESTSNRTGGSQRITP